MQDDGSRSRLGGGGFGVERRLGSGGFGDVYLAIDTNPQLPRRVALKILKRELARGPNFRDRFIRESTLAIEIDHHPNIVPVYDAGEEGETLFIAMRFVPGQNLQEQLAAHGRLSPARCVEVISAIASALALAHSVGIVHRDVKPANILINEETDQVYLADLGLTKRVDAESVLTMTGMFMGTLSYASPEQLDDQMIDARSDVYSLGCVLFECLTGRPPFVGGLDAVIAAPIRQDPPKVTAFRPEVGPAIDEVIAKALAPIARAATVPRSHRAHVPEAIQSSCSVENASAPAVVELGCTSTGGKTFLLYDQYAGAADLRAAYASQRSGIAIDSGDPSTGDCPGEGPLKGSNRITCEDGNPARWLHWTDYDLLIMSAASPFDDATPWPTLADQVPSLSPVWTRPSP